MPRAPPSASPHPSTFLPLPTRTPPRSTLFPYTTLFRSREDQQMVYTLRALKPDLAETKVYVDPPPGQIGRAPSELQSPMYLVCRLLLEKKKKPSRMYDTMFSMKFSWVGTRHH